MFVFVSMCRLDLTSLTVSHVDFNQVLLFVVLCARTRLIWFELYFSGVLISNTRSFPHSLLVYLVVFAVALEYGDMDRKLKLGIWENML